MSMQHHYIERFSGRVVEEKPLGDRLVRFIYDPVREKAPYIFKKITEARTSALLGFLNYDFSLGHQLLGGGSFLRESGINFQECLQPPEYFNSVRKVFERQIRYWECRPLPEKKDAIVSPADSRVLIGSLEKVSELFVKGKFFQLEALLGVDKRCWLEAFSGGDFSIFRLTPDKYHYNHTPVAGAVVDFYEIDGPYHSCNPGAVVRMATPYSKNRRVVTIINTDVPGGSKIGLVAMIEVVALMIGDIVQCYSTLRYEDPSLMFRTLFLEKGAPKSLFRPGSSTDILLFQKGRIRFADDLLRNQRRQDIQSRFSAGFGYSLVETDIKVRSLIAMPAKKEY
ncbi:MAG: phosphatidylserine decarboxylase [Deltaproteobacteria bacterium]|nr:phosphatidylserine decarboxylase [Deltaproteobacteria bacterium]